MSLDEGRPPSMDCGGNRRSQPEIDPHDRAIGTDHKSDDAPLRSHPSLALNRWGEVSVFQEVDKGGFGWQGLLNLSRSRPQHFLLTLERGAEARQLPLELLLLRGQFLDLTLPGRIVLRVPRVENERSQSARGLAQLGEEPGQLRLGTRTVPGQSDTLLAC